VTPILILFQVESVGNTPDLMREEILAVNRLAVSDELPEIKKYL